MANERLDWCTGEDEATAFLDGPPNNLSKQPEKGILKKSGGIYGPLGGPVGHPSLSLPLRMGSLNKEKWCEESQSDNQEVLSVLMSPDGTRSDRMGGASSLSDVERTLKSLNGYHEDILQVLRPPLHHSFDLFFSSFQFIIINKRMRKTGVDRSTSLTLEL